MAKNILLALCGLTPQVITETIYSLHEMGKRIDEVHVITTKTGKNRILDNILDPQKGHFFKYLEEYGIDPGSIKFSRKNIYVCKDEKGEEADDISTSFQNEEFLQLCFKYACKFTSDPENTVFFSIAGGRKTMSAYLALAAQTVGRPKDRIYHILVSPSQFETLDTFYYLPKSHRDIPAKSMTKSELTAAKTVEKVIEILASKQSGVFIDELQKKFGQNELLGKKHDIPGVIKELDRLIRPENKPIHSSKARIELISMPFIPGRSFINDRLIEDSGREQDNIKIYDILAGLAKANDIKPNLSVNVEKSKLSYGSMMETDLRGMEMAFYAGLAYSKFICSKKTECIKCTERECRWKIPGSDNAQLPEKYQNVLSAIHGRFLDSRARTTAAYDASRNNLRSLRTKINKRLASDCHIDYSERDKSFGLLIEKSRIDLMGANNFLDEILKSFE